MPKRVGHRKRGAAIVLAVCCLLDIQNRQPSFGGRRKKVGIRREKAVALTPLGDEGLQNHKQAKREMYIGQTTAKLNKRFYNHFSAAKRGSTGQLHSAIREYGKDAFEIELLQEFQSFEESDEAERKWIVQLNTRTPNGYNIEEGGCRNRGSLCEATKDKLREAAKHRPPGWYEKICYAARNRSPEWRKRLSESQKGHKSNPETTGGVRSSVVCLGHWRPSQRRVKDNGRAILT